MSIEQMIRFNALIMHCEFIGAWGMATALRKILEELK